MGGFFCRVAEFTIGTDAAERAQRKKRLIRIRKSGPYLLGSCTVGERGSSVENKGSHLRHSKAAQVTIKSGRKSFLDGEGASKGGRPRENNVPKDVHLRGTSAEAGGCLVTANP